MIIWQVSNNNGKWQNMPTPDSYKIDWEDLDNDSYRSVLNGNLIRSVITRRWCKVALSFSMLDDANCDRMLKAVNQDKVKFKFISPVFSNGTVSFEGYVSKMSIETDNIGKGWDVSFNVVQAITGDWQ